MEDSTLEDKKVTKARRNKIVQDRYRRNHRDRKLLSSKKYRENKERIRQWHHDHYFQYKAVRAEYSRRCVKERKLAVISHYSNLTNKCLCCGEPDIRFLTIDHINGNGNKHRRQNKIVDLARWLIRNNYPEGYQILCFNCNAGRSINKGICPHKDPIPISDVQNKFVSIIT